MDKIIKEKVQSNAFASPVGNGKNPADFLKVVENPYLYGLPDNPKIPGVNFLIDTEKMVGRIPTNVWFNNFLINRGAGSQPINSYVENRAAVTDGLRQIGYEDVKSLGAPCTLIGENGQYFDSANVPMDLNAPVINQGIWNLINGFWGLRFSSRHEGTFDGTSIVNLTEHIMTAGVTEGFAQKSAGSNCYSTVDEITAIGFRLNYQTAGGGTFTSYHLQGGPYLTFGYKGGVSPFFNSNLDLLFIYADGSDTGIPASQGATISGKSFIALYFSNNKVFPVIFYATSSIGLKVDFEDEYKTYIPGNTKPTDPRYVIDGQPAGTPYYSNFPAPTSAIRKLVATTPFEGIIRVANLPPLQVENQPGDGKAILAKIKQEYPQLLEVYDQYKTIVPIGGQAEITAKGAWTYTIQSADITQPNDPASLTANTEKPPLILLNQPDASCYQGTCISGITFRTIKGPLSFVAGNPLNFKIDTPSSTWFEEEINVIKGLSEEAQKILLKQFQDDDVVYGPNLWNRLQDLSNWPAYSIGKQFLSLATHILFYEKVLKDAGKTQSEIEQTLAPGLGSLKASLGKILDQGFYYDPKTGMVIESSSLNNAPYYAENYQNVAGQDHIFHYGYFVATSAILAHFDANWFQTPLPSYPKGNYSDVVNALIRNTCNPSQDDAFFTTWRSVDWMQGHATASGLDSMLGDGVNEESFAEEANFWKGTQMWAKEMNNSELEGIAATWLSRCGLSLQSWVAVGSKACVYDGAVLEALHKGNFFSVCNIWSKKAQATTWFGGGQPAAIGIETFTTIPAILEVLVDKTWLNVINAYYSAPDGNGSYVLMQKINELNKPGVSFDIWYSNLAPLFSMINPPFVRNIMDYEKFELDDSGTGLNTRSGLMFVLAYYEAVLNVSEFYGMPAYIPPVPFYSGELPGILQGWINFLNPENPNSPINEKQNPTADQLALMLLLYTQLQKWNKALPLNGREFCDWAGSTVVEFVKNHPGYNINSRGAGDWNNIMTSIFNVSGNKTCQNGLFS